MQEQLELPFDSLVYGRCRYEGAEDSLQALDPAMAPVPVHDVLDGDDVEVFFAVGGLDDLLEARERKDLSEIQECAGHRCNREAVDSNAIFGIDPPGPVNDDSL